MCECTLNLDQGNVGARAEEASFLGKSRNRWTSTPKIARKLVGKRS